MEDAYGKGWSLGCAATTKGELEWFEYRLSLAVKEDEGRSLGVAVQAEASNRPLVLRSRGVVLSELGKGRTGSGQVGIMESNVSEPLLKCRKQLRRRQNRSGRGATGSVRGYARLTLAWIAGASPAERKV